ncbi:MAG: HPr kinase/phosphorylase, partial [Acholeplasmataceae bacterium]
DIHGMGTLIIGKSGIGKSETALELVKRGHILIADDRVDVYEAAPGIIIGEAPNVLKGFLEIRGIGIVNVMQMFGAGSYRENKKVRLVIELEEWNNKKAYDRLGVSGEHFDVFGTTLPRVIIPILPGRNNATLVESAAMNEKLKFLGYNAALDLIEKVDKLASGNGENDE